MHVRIGPGKLAGCAELGFSLYEIQPDLRGASPFDSSSTASEMGEREREREEEDLSKQDEKKRGM